MPARKRVPPLALQKPVDNKKIAPPTAPMTMTTATAISTTGDVRRSPKSNDPASEPTTNATRTVGGNDERRFGRINMTGIDVESTYNTLETALTVSAAESTSTSTGGHNSPASDESSTNEHGGDPSTSNSLLDVYAVILKQLEDEASRDPDLCANSDVTDRGSKDRVFYYDTDNDDDFYDCASNVSGSTPHTECDSDQDTVNSIRPISEELDGDTLSSSSPSPQSTLKAKPPFWRIPLLPAKDRLDGDQLDVNGTESETTESKSSRISRLRRSFTWTRRSSDHSVPDFDDHLAGYTVPTPSHSDVDSDERGESESENSGHARPASFGASALQCARLLSRRGTRILSLTSSAGSSEDSLAPAKQREATGIRRSWSQVEMRHFKMLFQMKRAYWSELTRRHSYATSGQLHQSDGKGEVHLMDRVLPPVLSTNDVESFDEDGSRLIDMYDWQATEKKATDEQLRARQIRRFIVTELYTTECSYLRHLRTVKKMFMDPFVEAAMTSRPLVDPTDIPHIFNHVPELIRLSSRVAEQLATVVDPWREEALLGVVFIEMASEFEVYHHYAKNHQNCRMAIKRANQNVVYRKFVQLSRRKEGSDRLGLPDYVIMPIQRVTRYCLLLTELKKYTDDTHPDYADLCRALDIMVALASRCNEATRRHTMSEQKGTEENKRRRSFARNHVR